MIQRSFVPRLPFTKPLKKLFVSAIRRCRAPFALALVYKSLCGLKNDVQYTHVKCASREQCTLLCGFFRKVQLLLWPTQLAVVAPTFNDAFCDADYRGLTL